MMKKFIEVLEYVYKNVNSCKFETDTCTVRGTSIVKWVIWTHG